ncbi:MAG TPA: helix-turn-helix domain-containing protein [Candidatus Limnocylindrales bacterium]|nr:helix-turn-helix domain-containing protein [Candidatus Limnocylindrales bacterium]
MPDVVVSLRHRGFAVSIGEVVREARLLVGWSQRELAVRAAVSQATVSRIERGACQAIDVLRIERVLTALGIRASLQLDARHLEDRRRQLDGLHAVVNGFVARRLGRQMFLTATEVGLGSTEPRGWIDLLAFRPVDRALVVEESKTDIRDLGGLQRSLAFYERESLAAARRLGWDPVRVVVLVAALDTEVVHRRLADARDLVRRAFPAPVEATAAWLGDPAQPPPRGWTLATVDPASRSGPWLRPTLLGSRRSRPAYAGYTDAVARLLRDPGGRRRGGG